MRRDENCIGMSTVQEREEEMQHIDSRISLSPVLQTRSPVFKSARHFDPKFHHNSPTYSGPRTSNSSFRPASFEGDHRASRRSLHQLPSRQAAYHVP